MTPPQRRALTHRLVLTAQSAASASRFPVSTFVPITVLSGLDRVVVDDLATGLLLRDERLAVLYADPSPAERGYVTITVNDSDGQTRTRNVELEHRCASCTLRAATVAALTDLVRSGNYDALALQLHPGIEADAALRGLLAELAPPARLDSHVTVLPPNWLDILSGGSVLGEHDAAISDDDDRFAAAVLCAAIETATTIVLPLGGSDATAPSAEDRAVLELLAPAAVRLRLPSVLDVIDSDVLNTARLNAARLDPLADYGIRDPLRTLTPAGSLTLVRWHANRPLHPLRLHAALDYLADGVIRSSGRLDVADQPDSVVGWDSAGESLFLGPVAPCQEHPIHRRSALAFLGDDLDSVHIWATLNDCLLTDTELAILTSRWDNFAQTIVGRRTDSDEIDGRQLPAQHHIAGHDGGASNSSAGTKSADRDPKRSTRYGDSSP